jgi:hypothetical protein
MKMHRLVGISLKNPVDHDAMKMHVRIEQGAKAVDEGDGADAGRGTRTRAARAQTLLHRAQEDVQGKVLDGRIALQVIAQAFRYGQHPLPHRQARNDVVARWAAVSTMRRALQAGHTPRPLQE